MHDTQATFVHPRDACAMADSAKFHAKPELSPAPPILPPAAMSPASSLASNASTASTASTMSTMSTMSTASLLSSGSSSAGSSPEPASSGPPTVDGLPEVDIDALEDGSPGKEKAQVLWLGNVQPGVKGVELRHLFDQVLTAIPGAKAVHVRVKHHPQLAWDSAIIFLNMEVQLVHVFQGLHRVAPHNHFLVRKCRNTGNVRNTSRTRRRRRQKLHKMERMSDERHQAAQQAIEDFFTSSVSPLAAEDSADEAVRAQFQQEMDKFLTQVDTLPAPLVECA